MIHNTYPLQVQGSQKEASFTTYIHDHSEAIGIQKRPIIIVVPGGGYEYTSDREAETLALQFCSMGYHAAVVRYSVSPATTPTALLELGTAMLLIHQNAEKWHVDADKILVCGCSAGGHLAASLGCLWDEPFLSEALGLDGPDSMLLRPDGMILCYPVITSGKFAHKNSFRSLLGLYGEKEEFLYKDYDKIADEEITTRKEQTARNLLRKMSLEKQVSADTPQAFIWHTFEDTSVPVENSLLFVKALREAGVNTEFHMFAHGGHGLSLANEMTAGMDGKEIQAACAQWLVLVRQWLKDNFPITTVYGM